MESNVSRVVNSPLYIDVPPYFKRLIEIAAHQDLIALKAYLQDYAINIVDVFGFSALTYIAKSSYIENEAMLAFLIQHGAMPIFAAYGYAISGQMEEMLKYAQGCTDPEALTTLAACAAMGGHDRRSCEMIDTYKLKTKRDLAAYGRIYRIPAFALIGCGAAKGMLQRVIFEQMDFTKKPHAKFVVNAVAGYALLCGEARKANQILQRITPNKDALSYFAALGGRRHIVQALVGKVTSLNAVLEGAARGGHLELLLKYLSGSQNANFNFQKLMEVAATGGHLDIIENLRWVTTQIIDYTKVAAVAKVAGYFGVARKCQAIVDASLGLERKTRPAEVAIAKLRASVSTPLAQLVIAADQARRQQVEAKAQGPNPTTTMAPSKRKRGGSEGRRAKKRRRSRRILT